MEWKNIYRGFLMGICDLIPGVSGGTIAFILGIYDRLLTAISGLLGRDWKKSLGFLVPLGIGIAITLITFSRAIDFLLKYYKEPTHFFFLGLIVGVIPLMVKQANVNQHFRWYHFGAILVVGSLLAATALIQLQEIDIVTTLTVKSAIGLFFAGWAGSVAMLLPGISGSFVLLLLGVYSTAINALSNFNLPIMFIMGLGILAGFLMSSRAIKFLLGRFPTMMYAIIIGLILGSIFVIYPGIPESGTPFVMSIIALLTGLLVANIFQSIGSRKS